MPFDLPTDLSACDIEPIGSTHAWHSSGLHPRFVRSIVQVANWHNTIILIRPNHSAYANLLNYGYMTKSMYIHGKTCSWGPMTGFVCLDPTLHKSHVKSFKHTEDQLNSLVESLTHPVNRLSKVIPLMVPEERIVELITNQRLIEISGTSAGIKIVQTLCPELRDENGQMLSPGECIQFKLQPTIKRGKKYYYVIQLHGGVENHHLYFDFLSKHLLLKSFEASQAVEQLRQSFLSIIGQSEYQDIPENCLLSVVDPLCPLVDGHPLSATIGDYDLFAMHPLTTHLLHGCSPHRSLASIRNHRHRSGIRPRSSNAVRYPSHVQKTIGCPLSDHISCTSDTSVVKDRTDFPDRSSPMFSSAHQSAFEIGTAKKTDITIYHNGREHLDVGLSGRLNEYELHIIETLNYQISYHTTVTEGGEFGNPFRMGCNPETLRLFHHGPDSHNPNGTHPDLPCIAILPCATHTDKQGVPGCFRAVYITDIDELNAFYLWRVYACGYAVSPGLNTPWINILKQKIGSASTVDSLTLPDSRPLQPRLMPLSPQAFFTSSASSPRVLKSLERPLGPTSSVSKSFTGSSKSSVLQMSSTPLSCASVQRSSMSPPLTSSPLQWSSPFGPSPSLLSSSIHASGIKSHAKTQSLLLTPGSKTSQNASFFKILKKNLQGGPLDSFDSDFKCALTKIIYLILQFEEFSLNTNISYMSEIAALTFHDFVDKKEDLLHDDS